MPKARRNIGQEILEGLRQLKRGEHGRVTKVPSVTSIRERTGLSQPRFAELLGVSVRTLQEWEQGRRAPSGRTLPAKLAAPSPRSRVSGSSPSIVASGRLNATRRGSRTTVGTACE